MLITTLGNYDVQRTIRPLYAFTQATPKSCFLDPAWNRSVPIYPGMVAMKTTGENYTLLNGVGEPAGLFAQFIGGSGIDELLQCGFNGLGVWVMAPDAEFQILAPAFDSSLTWTDPGNGTDALIYAHTTSAAGFTQSSTTGLAGQLVPAGTADASVQPVARLISVDSASQLTIGGLLPRHLL